MRNIDKLATKATMASIAEQNQEHFEYVATGNLLDLLSHANRESGL